VPVQHQAGPAGPAIASPRALREQGLREPTDSRERPS
jgi:hypothetical protein